MQFLYNFYYNFFNFFFNFHFDHHNIYTNTWKLFFRAFKVGMNCIDDYSESCLTNEQRKKVENSVMGAKYTFKFLCDDARFKAGLYLNVFYTNS